MRILVTVLISLFTALGTYVFAPAAKSFFDEAGKWLAKRVLGDPAPQSSATATAPSSVYVNQSNNQTFNNSGNTTINGGAKVVSGDINLNPSSSDPTSTSSKAGMSAGEYVVVLANEVAILSSKGEKERLTVLHRLTAIRDEVQESLSRRDLTVVERDRYLDLAGRVQRTLDSKILLNTEFRVLPSTLADSQTLGRNLFLQIINKKSGALNFVPAAAIQLKDGRYQLSDFGALTGRGFYLKPLPDSGAFDRSSFEVLCGDKGSSRLLTTIGCQPNSPTGIVRISSIYDQVNHGGCPLGETPLRYRNVIVAKMRSQSIMPPLISSAKDEASLVGLEFQDETTNPPIIICY